MPVRPIIAVAVLAAVLPNTASADPPTSRPVNELDNVRVGNGTVIFEPGKPDDGYGGYNVPICAAPLPAGHQDAVAVEPVLRQLQAHIPRFRYLIHRDGIGDQGPGPVLPAMDTTDLTLGEWVNYVNAHCPGIHIEPDTTVSDHDPLYVVTLSPPAATTRPAAAVPHVVRAVSIRAAVQVQQRVRDEKPEVALADVLSLVQVLVDASPDGRGVKLKVHEATGMLVVDAPPPVADAVAAAVDTMSKLTPEQQVLLEIDRQRVKAVELDRDQANGRVRFYSDLADRSQQETQTANRTIADLEHQLQVARAATQPAVTK